MNEVVSGVNGWWAGYIVKDCHCAYTNGSALYYLFKTLARIYQQDLEINSKWLNIGLNVLDTVIHLQREDGGLGYTYATDKKQILDWDGFAGCWFAAAMSYAYILTNEKKYLHSAAKALDYYSEYVNRLKCYGTPMDTWKSIDEEGILSYIKAAKLMHEITSEEKYLSMAVNGACYEYLWRYSYKAKPEFEPLKSSSWNSCGGSITSVSNPHIHPMGLLITDELYYLADKTGDHYHKDRADDAVAWAMNCLEQYPNISGYGEYGIVSERWCPSDGLIIEEYSNKIPSSLWFAYNMWAASAMLEGFCESLLSNKDQI
jgi:hypothetical protein